MDSGGGAVEACVHTAFSFNPCQFRPYFSRGGLGAWPGCPPLPPWDPIPMPSLSPPLALLQFVAWVWFGFPTRASDPPVVVDT